MTFSPFNLDRFCRNEFSNENVHPLSEVETVTWLKGQRIHGQLIESQSENHWIVSVEGKLLGVQNQTGIPLKLKQWIELEVVGISPWKFQFIGKPCRSRRRMQVRI